ncbi:MAG: NAD-dependent epimerase/dehydratase family protein [Acidobacteriota bacterium]
MSRATKRSRKTAIVTGSAGFLGRRVVTEFKKHGWTVIGVDRVTTSEGIAGPTPPDEYRLLSLPSVHFGSLLSETKADAIVHAAGPASVTRSIASPEKDFALSVPVFFGVLHAVRRHASACRVVLISSAAVYGEPGEVPISEEQPTRPISPYGYHKAICETMMEEFASVYGVAGAVARVFSAYGAGLERQIMWDICTKAQAGRLTLFGTGDETRDFIHGDDVAAALRLIVEGGRLTGEAYNVANGVATSIRDLAGLFLTRLESEAELTFSGERRAGDPVGWRADIRRLRALGYRPAVKLEAGVADYVKWFLAQSSGQGRC